MSNARKATARNVRATSRKGKREDHGALLRLVADERRPIAPVKPRVVAVKPLTPAQARFDASMGANTCTFALGSAGTGKTWFAAARMAERLRDGDIERVVITRPAVEAGESLGFLPGELDEKFEPYFRPVRDAFEDILGKGHVEYLLREGRIEARPLALLRGSTLKNADVLLDEAQNTTPAQMKMFLTRIGEHTRVVVNGDPAQKDIPGKSGLTDAVDRLSGMRGVGVVRFGRDDVVRSGFCADVLEAYETPSEDPTTARYIDESNDNAPLDAGVRNFLKA